MKTILCFGDSNTFGYDCLSGGRFAPDVRWPGVLRTRLGAGWQVIEEGLNHRTTDLDDPDYPGRNGAAYLLPCLLSHRPLDLVIVMLGSNDMKGKFRRTAEEIGAAMAGLVEIVRSSACGPAGGDPSVLLVSPPLPAASTDYPDMYSGVLEKAVHLPRVYQEAAARTGARFLDAGVVRCPSPDGIHIGAAEHLALGRLVAGWVEREQCLGGAE